MNIGILGGTFDPVHLGHLAIAEEARKQLDLAEVIFVPAGNPYFKDGTKISPPPIRIDMLSLALSGKPYFNLSLIEIECPGPSYAVDTVSVLKEGIQKNDELFFILGWDSFLTLPLWRNPKRLMALCRFVVAPRPGFPERDTLTLEKQLPGISERTVVMDKPLIDISSTQVREKIVGNKPINDLVPAAVAVYIKTHGLYQTGAHAPGKL
jgi:nicotinate-nucleotide adenylyltransferase